MFLWHRVPTWHEIENRITREMGYQGGARYRTHFNEPAPSVSLNIRRVNSVRSAFIQAEWEAGRLLRQRFADLDIASILNELIDVVAQMAMIVAGSVLIGGAIGAGTGAFLGGAGAIPMGAAGAAMGLQVSTWILGILGLTSIAEFFVEGLPRIGEYYLRGIHTAWNGPRGEGGLDPFRLDDPSAQYSAAHQIALGHVEVVVLLLGAIVAYITRGRGNAGALAQEMRASPKGARLGEWMLKHEEALKKRPDLQTSAPRRGTLSHQDPAPPANHPPCKDKNPPRDKPNAMPLHKVECFKADKLPESKIGEFERQLTGQEDGLNRLTVDEYLENIANPVKRNPKAAKQAREDLLAKLQERFQEDFSQIMDELDAEEAAIKKAKETMSNLAGLHNPDLSAGGKDIIADFGDRQVNSSIGPQWRPKIANLKTAAENVPQSMRESTFLNVQLHKC
jgi:preprotein translocase subunit SecG